MSKAHSEAKIEFVFSIDIDRETCELVRQSLDPDNNPDIEMKCTDETLEITVRNLRTGSLYNTIDDIIRSYETSKKIMDERI